MTRGNSKQPFCRFTSVQATCSCTKCRIGGDIFFLEKFPSDWQKISDFSDFKSLTSGFCAERKILFFLWYFGLSILQFGLQILILPLHTASPTLDPRSINICGFKTWWTADLRRKLSPTKAIPQNERRNIYQQYTMSYPKFKQNIWVKSHKIGRPKKNHVEKPCQRTSREIPQLWFIPSYHWHGYGKSPRLICKSAN